MGKPYKEERGTGLETRVTFVMLWQNAKLLGKRGSLILIFSVQLKRFLSNILKPQGCFVLLFIVKHERKEINDFFKQTDVMIWEFLSLYRL